MVLQTLCGWRGIVHSTWYLFCTLITQTVLGVFLYLRNPYVPSSTRGAGWSKQYVNCSTETSPLFCIKIHVLTCTNTTKYRWVEYSGTVNTLTIVETVKYKTCWATNLLYGECIGSTATICSCSWCWSHQAHGLKVQTNEPNITFHFAYLVWAGPGCAVTS